ncbi:MAG: tetratricopeptide repeat protein [Bacteroidetes bacterium]|nr:tetratricopeptide repeat protein [Bacteroidota bacterium]
MKAFITGMLLLIFSNLVYGQNANQIKSLLQQLQTPRPDSELVDVLSSLSYNYSIVNTDSALYYGNKALLLAEKIKYHKGIADANNNIGWAYACRGDNDNAKKFLGNAESLFTAIGDKNFIPVSLVDLANVFVSESDYPKALSYFSKALQYFEEVKNDFRSAEVLFSIGRIYNLEKNPVMARSYFQQAYNIHQKDGNELYMAQALSSIANTYQFEEKFDTALTYYKRVVPVFIKNNDLYRTGNTYENIAVAYINKKMYKDALHNMQLAKKYYEQSNRKSDIAYAMDGTGDIYAALGDTEKSIENYNAALQIAGDVKDRNLQQQVLASLSDVYLKERDYKSAYLMLDSSYRIKDSLFTKEKQDELLKLQTQFETERKEKENELLKAQNLTSNLKLEKNKEWLIATIAALLAAGILLFALYKNRQTKIKHIEILEVLNRRLEDQKEEIIRMNNLLEQKALRAQMNPHFIFNCMSSIQECLLTGRMDEANTYLTKLSRLMRMVLNYSDVENISLDKELQMLLLYLQLEKIRLKNNFEYTIQLSDDIVPEELEVPTLILQPFAENAIWHGLVNKKDNRHLIIEGKIMNDILLFSIIDNGIGREKSETLKKSKNTHESKAIKLVEKRLSIINKDPNYPLAGFTIQDLYDEDHNGTGTSVEIKLPLKVI